MQKNPIGYIFFFLGCFLILACQRDRKDLVSYASMDTLSVSSKIFDHPFEIPINRTSLNYVRLETGLHPTITHIDQLKIYLNTIFILDRSTSSLTFFDITGKFIKSITIKNTSLQYFDILDNEIYLLDRNQSKLFKFNLQGKLLKTIHQDFHGVQFAALPGDKFIYNTCGLITRDGESEKYQLSMPGLKKADMQLPFKPIYSGIKYLFENQFSRNGSQVFFTSAFENVIYKIDTTKITALTKFDFGNYNMPDSIFLKGKAFDNFNAFPYVSDLVNVANNSRFSFFKFSYNNRQGYVLSDSKRKKVIAGGIDVVADEASDFNNSIPVCSYGDKFVAVVSPKDWLKMSSELDLSSTKLNKKYPMQSIKGSDAPILLFYTLL